MCELSINNITSDPNDFSVEFQDCQGDIGAMDALLLHETANNGFYQFSGTDTSGQSFHAEEVVPNSERVNPTKVFELIARKLKEVLCPKCM